MLQKRCLKKIGNCRENQIAKEQENDAAFIVAWNEFLLIVEHMEKTTATASATKEKTQQKTVAHTAATSEMNGIDVAGASSLNSSKYL